MLLALKGLGLQRDVLGEGVQRGQSLLGPLCHLLERPQRCELLLDLPRGIRRALGVLVRFARRVPDAGVVLGQLLGHAAQLLDLRARGRERLHRLPRVGHHGARLDAGGLERLALLARGVERGLCPRHLGGQRAERRLQLAQFAVRRQHAVHDALRRVDVQLEGVDPPADFVGRLRRAVDLRELTGHFLQLRRSGVGLAVDGLEALAEMGDPRPPAVQLAEHRAERHPLLARGVQEFTKFFSRIARGFALRDGTDLLQRLEHAGLSRLSRPPARRPASRRQRRWYRSRE